MSHMAKTEERRPRRKFADEFKAGAVRLVLDEGKTAGAVARELDLTESALREWVARALADRTKGKSGGLTTAEGAGAAAERGPRAAAGARRPLQRRGGRVRAAAHCSTHQDLRGARWATNLRSRHRRRKSSMRQRTSGRRPTPLPSNIQSRATRASSPSSSGRPAVIQAHGSPSPTRPGRPGPREPAVHGIGAITETNGSPAE